MTAVARVPTGIALMPTAPARYVPTFFCPMTITPAGGPTCRFGQSGDVAALVGIVPWPTTAALARSSCP